jgi:hypothetical protein
VSFCGRGRPHDYVSRGRLSHQTKNSAEMHPPEHSGTPSAHSAISQIRQLQTGGTLQSDSGAKRICARLRLGLPDSHCDLPLPSTGVCVWRSAELHAAVSQIRNLHRIVTGQRRETVPHSAEYNSAIRQIDNLRYEACYRAKHIPTGRGIEGEGWLRPRTLEFSKEQTKKSEDSVSFAPFCSFRVPTLSPLRGEGEVVTIRLSRH